MRDDEAPIKRPLSRGKSSPGHEILFFCPRLFMNALFLQDRHLHLCRDFYGKGVSSLSRIFAAPSTHQDQDHAESRFLEIESMIEVIHSPGATSLRNR